MQLQPSNPTYDDSNGIWLNKAELEHLIHSEYSHQPNQLNQKLPKKDDFQKPSAASNSIANNRDQMHVIYDI